MPDIDAVARWVAAVDGPRITVLTGAGVSTDSGVPDFRGPQGVWTRNPAAQRLFDIDAYVADLEVRRAAWQGRRNHAAWTALPNAAHEALVRLERSGRLRAVVTQNIDGLHQAAGSDPSRVIELHGTIFRVECLACGRETAMREALDRVDAGDDDPACTVCGGIQKSATISFGQSLREDVLAAAIEAARDCDLFLAVGTTLLVQPAATLADLARVAGARLVIVNRDPTPYDSVADAVLREPIGDVLPRFAAAADV